MNADKRAAVGARTRVVAVREIGLGVCTKAASTTGEVGMDCNMTGEVGVDCGVVSVALAAGRGGEDSEG